MFFCLSIIPKFPKIREKENTPIVKNKKAPFMKKFPDLNNLIGFDLINLTDSDNKSKFSNDATMANTPFISNPEK